MFPPRHARRSFRTPRRAARWRVSTAAAGLALAAGATACRRSAPVPPAAEFLAVTADSTYWLTSGPAGINRRAAPLFLARWGGRLAEVYLVDDGARFAHAEFATVRLYRRDLLRGDSALVLADGQVPRLAARYAAAHPADRVLADDEDANSAPDDEDDGTPARPDDGAPPYRAEYDLRLLAAHGPYLTVDVRTTIDAPDGGRRETVTRRVLDLRTGRAASLANLFGARAAVALVRAGADALAGARDSLARAAQTEDARATADSSTDQRRARALAAVPSLHFDPTSFGLEVRGTAPVVRFVARGEDADGAVTLALPPLALPAGTGEPAWWTADVRPTLPDAHPEAARVLARAWRDGVAPAPEAQQVVPLARPPADTALRRAVRRAFDESLAGDETTVAVARRHRAGGRPRVRAPRSA